MKKASLLIGLFVAFVAEAYLPPVETKGGVRVEIGSFPQKIERPGKNPYAWPLGVTVVSNGAARAFPVTVSNGTDKAVSGELAVWMNDDWDVTGPTGTLTLAPREGRTLTFAGTAKPRALDALYPVHARFVPTGVAPTDAPHPIAIFHYRNPQAPRAVTAAGAPKLGPGAFRLDRHFVRMTSVEVAGKVHALASGGDGGAWGGHFTKGDLHADGVRKPGFNSHPPYLKGAGFIWSDFPLSLPAVTPIAFDAETVIFSNRGQPKAPPSDGVEYKVFVLEEGRAPKLVAAQIVTKPLVWHELAADLSPWAGKAIALRLWTGPGPKLNTCCDGGGWGDVKLAIGPQPKPPTAADWAAREAEALARAKAALASGTDAAAGRWRLVAEGDVFGAGVAFGARGLVDGALAFADGEKAVVYRGFAAEVETGDGGSAPEAKAEIREEKGTLRIAWSIPGRPRGPNGFPRIARLAVGPASERTLRVYAGFGNVVEGPKDFVLTQSGFGLSTRHVGADYANGLSVVQATDVPPDRLVCDGAKNIFALEAHHDAAFTFVPSAKGSFAAARRFRAVAGYRRSPGLDKLGARMCLDQWGGDYAKSADDLRLCAKYGLTDAIFVKHVWQGWGYDYRLPEIYPPMGDVRAFGEMREACRAAGILFCPHDNYTDIYPDAENYSYDLVVFNLDGTPQKAWFNPGRHARSYRWAPHAFRPWCLRNAKLLKAGCDPDAVFIDVFTAHGPFDYLDREGRFHTKMETSASWANGFAAYREGYGRPDAVCVSEAGQDHLVGVADAGESDHFGAAKVLGGPDRFADAERTPWHDIVTHGYYVLFAGGLGGRYQEESWHAGGDRALHGYASDDYLSNAILGGRNPMCEGPFCRDAVKTYWLQHDACAELGRSEFLDLRYVGNIHRQHAIFTDGEVWANRQTNAVWKLANGVVLPPYGYYAKTRGTESGVVEKDGVRCAFAKSGSTLFCDARQPADTALPDAESQVLGAERLSPNRLRLTVQWETLRPSAGAVPFVHVCDLASPHEGIVFHANLALPSALLAKPGRAEIPLDVNVPGSLMSGSYAVRYGAYYPKTGQRLRLGGAETDAGGRLHGGTVRVAAAGGRVTDVVWRPEAPDDARLVRDRLLGVNRAGKAVDFGGLRTNGSFRFADWTLTPLPGSAAFAAEIDLAAFGRANGQVAAVEAVEPKKDATAPAWRQEGGKLILSADAKAFAYRVRFR